MYTTSGWARASKEAGFEKIQFQRKSGGPGDVTFKLKYCGVCHSDVHIANDDLGGETMSPIMMEYNVDILTVQVGRSTRVCRATSWRGWSPGWAAR